nr:ComEC/Rec2 family competence protein [Candidatus Levybacteria bacterium]
MKKSLFIFISFLIVILGIRLFIFYSTKPEYKEGDKISFSSRILSEPNVYKNYQSFWLELPNTDRVFVKTEIYPEYYFQDEINLFGTLKFKLLNDKTRILSIDYPKISLVPPAAGLAVVKSIRQKIITVFDKALPKDLSGLMLGIVFGIKQNLSKEFLDSLKTAGVMHVIAASGMNVTMTAGFIFYLFSLIFKRQLAVALSILGILFYAFLAGFEASIVRASIMGIIAFSSQILGKQQYSFYALLLTCFAMLFAVPKYLLDIGFALSFTSTLGILFIPRVFSRFQNVLSEGFLTTISAQIATLPILLSNFGAYSLWSVVCNVLVLWTVPFLMIIGGIAALISFVLPSIASLFLYLCLPLLFYFVKIVGFFGGLRGSIVAQTFPWQFSAAYYLLLASFLLFYLKRND